MFANRSIRLLLLASTAIPVTFAVAASKMTTPSTAAEMQVQQQQAAPAVMCGMEKTHIYEGNFSSQNDAKANAEQKLKDYCTSKGCDADETSIVVEKVYTRDNIDYYAAHGQSKEEIKSGGRVIGHFYWGFCKDKLMNPPMNLKPGGDMPLQAE